MIFYRSPTVAEGPLGPSVARMRVYTTTALVAFPLGALMGLFDVEGPAGSAEAWLGVALAVAHVALLILAFFMIFKAVRSPLQRIVGDEEKRLDEREVHLRQRALSWSYGTIGALFLLLIIYMALAQSFGLWMPASYDQWSGMFWCVFVYIVLTPTAFLAWTMDPREEDED